ncbi:MAG: hypothetical protein PHE26_03550, partial [Syntrophomonadaceae bacterium]|nr:hypothetical protein [Syntrophomonadaceae bacterium]
MNQNRKKYSFIVVRPARDNCECSEAIHPSPSHFRLLLYRSQLSRGITRHGKRKESEHFSLT